MCRKEVIGIETRIKNHEARIKRALHPTWCRELRVTKYELVRLPRTLRGVGEHTKRDVNEEMRVTKYELVRWRKP